MDSIGFSLDWLRPPAGAASWGTPNFRGFGRDRDPGHFYNFAALGAANASSSRNSCVSESGALSLVSETTSFREMGAAAPPVGAAECRGAGVLLFPGLPFWVECDRRTDMEREVRAPPHCSGVHTRRAHARTLEETYSPFGRRLRPPLTPMKLPRRERARGAPPRGRLPEACKS